VLKNDVAARFRADVVLRRRRSTVEQLECDTPGESEDEQRRTEIVIENLGSIDRTRHED